MIDMKEWQQADALPQKAALVARGAVAGPAGGPFRVNFGHRSMPSVWPDTEGIAYHNNLGWRGVIEMTPEDPTYFGVLSEGEERVAVTREAIIRHVDWFASPNSW